MGGVADFGAKVVGSRLSSSPFGRVLGAMGSGQGLGTADTAFQPKVEAPSVLPATPVNKTTPAGQRRDPAQYRGAISSIESGGRYDTIGPTNAKLGRALGKYQVMEANLPAWSREALGREVTADEFLANPAIQDQIFDKKFGQYVDKFGEAGAAQAWFAGPGGVGKTNRKDVLGTSVGSYGEKFMTALGSGTVTAGATPPKATSATYKPFSVRMFGGSDMTPGEGETAQKGLLGTVAEGVAQGGPRGSMGVAQAAESETAPAVDLGAEEVAGNQQALIQRAAQGTGSTRGEQRKAEIKKRIGGLA